MLKPFETGDCYDNLHTDTFFTITFPRFSLKIQKQIYNFLKTPQKRFLDTIFIVLFCLFQPHDSVLPVYSNDFYLF